MAIETDAAVAVVLAQEPERSVLLIRRAERVGDSWSGHWSFPGGRRDPGDPDVFQTAMRELHEECGIELSREHIVRLLPNVVAMREVRPFVTVAPVLFEIDRELPTVVDYREAVESVWVPVRELADPARHQLQPVPGRPLEMLYPAIELNGLPLWGFTYRLITQWLQLLPNTVPLEEAGFETACGIRRFLTSRGLPLRGEWEDRIDVALTHNAVKEANVEGVIPASEVLTYLSIPGDSIPAVNCVEVRPDHIRVTGLAMEQYVIYGSRVAKPES
jgi:8-oxo-dGTP pyrophosphatase MutT (NUDIX family)